MDTLINLWFFLFSFLVFFIGAGVIIWIVDCYTIGSKPWKEDE